MTALHAVTEPDVMADVLAELRSLREVIDGLGTREAPPLLDAEQAAALLRVPASWILAEARAERIPTVRLGRYVRFDRFELTTWTDGRTVGPRSGRRA